MRYAELNPPQGGFIYFIPISDNTIENDGKCIEKDRFLKRA
jgi:hypothetical protein